jgi:hypothetical protein
MAKKPRTLFPFFFLKDKKKEAHFQSSAFSPRLSAPSYGLSQGDFTN